MIMLDLAYVIAQTIARGHRWHPRGIKDWSSLEWAGAMCGEAGEAANVAKKLKRVETEMAHVDMRQPRSATFVDATAEQAARYRQELAREVADTILYGILVCAAVDVDLLPVLVQVFNQKSEEYGFPERIGVE